MSIITCPSLRTLVLTVMKKDLVAAIFFIVCSISLRACAYAEEFDSHHIPPIHELDLTDDLALFKKCLKFEHTVKKCAARNLGSHLAGQKVQIGSECCGVIKEFDKACVPNFLVFEIDNYLFGWLNESCGQQQDLPSPAPASSTKPTPVGNQPSSSPFDLPFSTFEPPELPLPQVFPIGYDDHGCVLSVGVKAHSWRGIPNTRKVHCVLKREKGTQCDSGDPYDRVSETCWLYYNHRETTERNKVVRVNPRFGDSSD